MISLYQFRPTPADEMAVLTALREGKWADGPGVRAFEEDFVRYLGIPHAIATSSGTTALQAICAACLTAGDEVLTTPLTFIATINALRSVGAVPRFADVDPATGNLDPAAATAALRRYPRIRAVLLVHLYGCPCHMDAYAALAREHGLVLLEDCAQAAGAAWAGRPVGGLGLAAAFSFYATKNLAAGEGGMVVTADPGLAAAVRRFINHGRPGAPSPAGPYCHESLGYNFRMHGLAAALGRSRLKELDRENAARRAHAAAYRAALSSLPGVTLPPDVPGHAYHQFVIQTPSRDALRDYLAARGIETGVYYSEVVYRQPACAGMVADTCPVAERLAREVLALPIRASLTLAEREKVSDAIQRFLRVSRA